MYRLLLFHTWISSPLVDSFLFITALWLITPNELFTNTLLAVQFEVNVSMAPQRIVYHMKWPERDFQDFNRNILKMCTARTIEGNFFRLKSRFCHAGSIKKKLFLKISMHFFVLLWFYWFTLFVLYRSLSFFPRFIISFTFALHVPRNVGYLSRYFLIKQWLICEVRYQSYLA